MIKSYRHKGLRELADRGESRKVAADLQPRVVRRLDALKAARLPKDMNIPGFNFHPLHGKPLRSSVHVNGPWCLTFGWEDDAAIDVDLAQYH